MSLSIDNVTDFISINNNFIGFLCLFGGHEQTVIEIFRLFTTKQSKNLLFVASCSVKALPALAEVIRHCTEPAVLTVGRTGSIPTIRPAEPVRARADVVSYTESSILAFWLARN